MKQILILLCVGIVSVVAMDKNMNELSKTIDRCIEATGIGRASSSAFLDENETTDHDVKCIVACVARDNGFITDEEIDVKKLRNAELHKGAEAHYRAAFREKFENCLNNFSATGDVCESAYNLYKCSGILLSVKTD